VPPVLSAINAIAGSDVNPQFDYAFANWPHVSEGSLFQLPEPSGDSCFRQLVPEMRHPILKGKASVLVLIVDDLKHRVSVA